MLFLSSSVNHQNSNVGIVRISFPFSPFHIFFSAVADSSTGLVEEFPGKHHRDGKFLAGWQGGAVEGDFAPSFSLKSHFCVYFMISWPNHSDLGIIIGMIIEKIFNCSCRTSVEIMPIQNAGEQRPMLVAAGDGRHRFSLQV